MNKYTATANIRLDTRVKRKNDTYSTMLEIYFKGKKRRYSTKTFLTKNEWDKIQSSTLKDEKLKKIKKELSTIQTDAQKRIDLLGDEFNFEHYDAISDVGVIKRTIKNYNDAYFLFDDYIKDLEDQNRVGTAVSYRNAENSLKGFKESLRITDISVKFLEQYENYMLENNKSITTVGIYLRSLRTIVNIARDKKVLSDDDYPFGLRNRKKYEIPRGNNTKKALNDEDITKIVKYIPVSPEEAYGIDIWLFSFYCNGMNMKDIFNLKYENIQNGFLNFYRQKTIRTRKQQESIEIAISEPIKRIIEKWGNIDKSKHCFIFNTLERISDANEQRRLVKNETRKVNIQMKKIGKKLEIDCPITTYVARHSWATFLLRNNVSPSYISKGLGHSSFATTEQYLAGFNKDQKIQVSDLLTKLGE